MALCACVQEGVWLRRLMNDLQVPGCGKPTKIMEDNQGALALVADRRFSERSKHISIRYFFVAEQVADGNFIAEYCNTHDMVADLFTKPLSKDTFQRLRALTGLKDLVLDKSQ